MITILVFTAAGLASGFFLRFVGFAIGAAALIAGYGVILSLAGATSKMVAIDLLLALLFSQVGYAASVLARIALVKLKQRLPGTARIHADWHVRRSHKSDPSKPRG